MKSKFKINLFIIKNIDYLKLIKYYDLIKIYT